MKIISLWQPWATLISLSEKKIETRSWSTDYRGPLAIHSAQTVKSIHLINEGEFKLVLSSHGYHKPSQLPFGHVLCIVELDWVQPTETIRWMLSERELTFGNYSDGRFAWGLRLLKVFDPPIPERGRQRFWNWEEPTL